MLVLYYTSKKKATSSSHFLYFFLLFCSFFGFFQLISVYSILSWEFRFQRRLINTLINAVYLFDDKVVIYYNIRGIKQISYIEMIRDAEKLSEPVDSGSDSLKSGSPSWARTNDTLINSQVLIPTELWRKIKYLG